MNIGLCLPDPHPGDANDGSSDRTLSAIRFAGRYRLVDFILSNMSNSDITSIGIILNSQYQSLVTHIGSGKEWDLSRKSGGVTLFPPYLTDDRMAFMNELDGPLQRALEYVAKSRAEYVVLTECSTLYNIDYREVINAHKQSGADITAVYTKKRIEYYEQKQTIAYEMDENGRINEVLKSAYYNEQLNVSLNTFVMRRPALLRMLSGERSCGMVRLSCDILPRFLGSMKIYGYEFSGYSAQISSLETFFHHNMDMLDIEKRNNLFRNGNRRIYTNIRDSLPTKYRQEAEIKNAIIADGCQIGGYVENCVIFRNVVIKPGARVRNSILQEGTVVERGSELDWVVTDRSVIITEDRNIMGYKTYPVYIEKEKVV